MISLKKADKVKTLADMHSVFKLDDHNSAIDASKLFQRLLVVAHSDRSCNMSSAFEYELTVYPTSLFRDGMMRKPDKPNLFRNCLAGMTPAALPHDVFYVIDGGCLLHKVRWLKGQTVGQLLNQYSAFIQRRFRGQACVVFDGYTGEPSIKDHEHARRTAAVSRVAPNVQMEPHSTVMFEQESVLANDGNKQQLISMLAHHLKAHNIEAKVSAGDADVDIAATALELAQHDRKPVAVYAEDTDILALLVHHRQPHMNVFMEYDRKTASQPHGRCIDINALQSCLGSDICQNILVLHAFGGCDTTSAIYGHGKGSILTRLCQNTQVAVHTASLQSPNATVDAVKEAGVALMVALYSGKEGDDLSALRYSAYCKMAVAKGGSFLADRLPPSTNAAELHSLRVHLQAVFWKSLGKVLLPASKWGWRLHRSKLQPIAMTQQPGPPHLMSVIRCNCTTHCRTQHCSCRKNRLKCIEACGHCHGVDCDNVELVSESNVESDTSDAEIDIMDGDSRWHSKETVDSDDRSQRMGSDFFFDVDMCMSFADEEVV